ncbi:MAG: TrkA family potassium uptake protein, partial [Gemmatimonadales bacterium]
MKTPSLLRVPPLLRPFLAVLAVGTIGYALIEGVPLWDAFFMTVITVTTVGYREIFPLSRAGQALTVVIVIFGIGTVVYGLGEYFSTVRINLGRHRLMQALERLTGHYIICGYGRVGQNVANTLRDAGRTVLVVDRDEARTAVAEQEGFLTLAGDATNDETLKQLGIERAIGFVVSTTSDSDNLFVVLSARTLNPKMMIVARAADAANAAKFRRAGADRVVSPYEAGGRYIANSMIRPNLTEFLDRVTLSGVELWLEEIVVPAGTPLAGRTIAEADLP